MIKDSRPVRVVNLGSVSFAASQSAYHAVADLMDEQTPDTIIFCSPRQPYFCIGFHQDYAQVIDEPGRVRIGYPVLRRRLGGGTTYLDSGQLFYQCIFHRKRSSSVPAQSYRTQLAAPIQALRRLGLNAKLKYANEIEISGQRAAGIGGGRIGHANVVVGNFLRKFDYDAMAAVIRAPCDEFREVALHAMRQAIATVSPDILPDQLWDEMPQILFEEYSNTLERTLVWGELTAAEQVRSDDYAQLLGDKMFLRQYCRPDTAPDCIVRLKVSGSTFVHLVRAGDPDEVKFAVLQIRDDIIERVEFAARLTFDGAHSNQSQPLPCFRLEDLQVQRRYSQLSAVD